MILILTAISPASPCRSGILASIISLPECHDRATILLCHAGAPLYCEDGDCLPLGKGVLLVNPNMGGWFRSGYSSLICFPADRTRLDRTAFLLHRASVLTWLDRPLLGDAASPATRALFSLFAFVDSLIAVARRSPLQLGLDEQIDRLLATLMAGAAGHTPFAADRLVRAPAWTARLDDLVDYIRAHSHLPLALSDLEERSHYSARHLQSLFRDKFDCTPMQFVRRQRLLSARQRLESPGPLDSVTGIARECGYRYLSNFSSDFQREFGITPSLLLRASQGG